MKYVIEYDEIYKEWVVWEKISKSAKQEIFKNKYKRVCREYLQAMEEKKGLEVKNGRSKKRRNTKQF